MEDDVPEEEVKRRIKEHVSMITAHRSLVDAPVISWRWCTG